MIIRNAKIEDVVKIRDLLEQLGYNLSLAIVTKKLEIYLNKDIYKIMVAEEKNEILGFIAAICYESLVLENGCMHIESLVIDQSARGKGIGHKLIAAIEEYAKDNSYYYSELITSNFRRKGGTHNFYENLGYQDHDKTEITYFSKKLN